MAGHHAAQTRARLSDFESLSTADAGSHSLRWGENTKFGGYILADSAGPDARCDSDRFGSEVSLCVGAYEKLLAEGSKRVVSLPSGSFSSTNPRTTKTTIPPAVKARVAVEQAARFGWQRYASRDAIIGMRTFGASAPLKELTKSLVSRSKPWLRPPKKRSQESNNIVRARLIRPRIKGAGMSNPLVEVMKLGQSIWYDNIRRAMLVSGDLKMKIEQDDLRGVTSNPTIFERRSPAQLTMTSRCGL